MSKRISEDVADIYFPKIRSLLKQANKWSYGRFYKETLSERIKIRYGDTSFRIEFLNRKKMIEIYINYIHHRDISVTGCSWFQDIRQRRLRDASQKATDDLAISIMNKVIKSLEDYIKDMETKSLRSEMNKIKGANSSLKNWV